MILAGQKDDKLILIDRLDQKDESKDVLLAQFTADEAERFAKAILATVPRVRETEQKMGRTREQKIQQEIEALDARRRDLKASLK